MPAISVEGLSKCYNIYDHPQDRLKQAILPRMQWLASSFRPSSAPRQFFREFWALRDVSFEVQPGETLGILGRNGAGKSTLLQIIAGTLTPTAGESKVNGRVAALLELGSGFNPEFSGRENVFMNAALLGLSQKETESKFDEIAAFADIGDFLDQPTKTYSSGMMVRLAFAVQTAVEPAVLIVDEALAVGDARFQKKCYERLERFRQNGGTVLFVTHDTGVIVQICSRAMVLEKGEVLEIGEPHRIAKVYHRLLFGDPNETSFRFKPNSLQQGSAESSSGVALPESAKDNRALAGSRELRYGSRELEIFEVGIRDSDARKTTLLDTGEEYVFFFTVRYAIPISDPVSFGFTITNTRGTELYGTKGGLHDLFLPPGPSGTLVESNMRLTMRLVPGEYFLTVAVAPNLTTASNEFYDLRFDALQFRVIGTPGCFTTSVIDLDGDLSYREIVN